MAMDARDEDLARAAAGGDGTAFSALLERHYDRVFALAFRLTGARAEAEDLTQDVCAALPAKLGSYDGRASVRTWLYRVVVNAAHDRRRRQRTRARAAEGWGDWEVSRRAAMAEAGDRAAWLMASLAALPEEIRDTLALTLDGTSQAEAAEVLGVAPGTIAWRVSEAKRRLAAMRAEEERA